MPPSSAFVPPEMTRRVWTAEEKLSALDYFHETRSKKRTCRELSIPCTKMLRNWLSVEGAIRSTAAAGDGAARRIARGKAWEGRVECATAVGAFLAWRGCASSSVTGGGESSRDSGDMGEQCEGERSGECVDAESNGGRAGGASAPALGGAGGVGAREAVPVAALEAMVDGWLMEDCPGFDYGGAVVGSREVTAVLFAKSAGVLAGCVFFDAVFRKLGCEVRWSSPFTDGSVLALPASGKLPVATVRGPARLVLQGERVALNTLAECSGIASAAARVVDVARAAGWRGRLAGTRKTTPGFRLVQKYGMMVGGMDTHRMDLSSMIMLKDNHIAAAGSIPDAVQHAKHIGGFSLKIDVECGDEDSALVAAEAGADVVMLDNFGPSEFRQVAQVLKRRYPDVIVEGSGGLTEETVAEFMCPEADVLSFSINRYATALDMSLKIQEEPRMDR